ncbi:hypothetical protein AVEN_133618-1 [Araneus ventricosus]|nr:hypothetical protein AVEN_133618-1 [Araneus ventricosus]
MKPLAFTSANVLMLKQRQSYFGTNLAIPNGDQKTRMTSDPEIPSKLHVTPTGGSLVYNGIFNKHQAHLYCGSSPSIRHLSGGPVLKTCNLHSMTCCSEIT